ncbi:uncharacterized protein [Miscanthus floridulus]|uniref:uncharacterized protein n=1 Tax=Miscanthus floridulus TaxID=154761 RepID=UPI00345ACF12
MGKGKVHPSPSPAAVAAGGGAGEMTTAEAVLMRLLPAAVIAAAAPLGAEGKEVLAYLVLASLRSSAPPTPTPARGGDGKAAGEHHRPELGCGCFGCYTAYWSRWDGSPEGDREAIHRAIEAFDEHLAEEERDRGGGKGGGGRRGRKKRAGAAAKDAVAAAKEKAKGKGKEKELGVDSLPPLPLLHPAADLPAPEEAPKMEDGAEYLTAEDEKEEASTAAAGGDDEKRRRGWGSVLSWKAWGLWGSH